MPNISQVLLRMVEINKALLDSLTEKAKASPRLRINFDLRNSDQDMSQRMLNAVEPGTVVPVHRHRYSSETVVCVRGALREIFYDKSGSNAVNVVEMVAGGACCGINIPKGEWHTIEVLESGTVILEVKDGPYAPMGPEDVIA